MTAPGAARRVKIIGISGYCVGMSVLACLNVSVELLFSWNRIEAIMPTP
jgi:hypothetical protein